LEVRSDFLVSRHQSMLRQIRGLELTDVVVEHTSHVLDRTIRLHDPTGLELSLRHDITETLCLVLSKSTDVLRGFLQSFHNGVATVRSEFTPSVVFLRQRSISTTQTP